MRGAETRDVIVVGAGPAGLAAAQAVARHGLAVRLIDEQAAAGGQIWRNAARLAGRSGSLSKSQKGATEALAALSAAGVDHAASATVLDVTVDEVTFDWAAVEGAAGDGAAAEAVRLTWLSALHGDRGIRETAARALIVATGAMERPLLFPGATLPGVMGVGAVQSILKQSGMVPTGKGTVLAGQGPLLLLTLSQILDHGGTVDAVLDFGPGLSGGISGGISGGPSGALSGALPALIGDPALMAQGAALLWRARRSGAAWYRNVRALRAAGGDGVEQVTFEAGGKPERLPCALLAVHDGVIPNTQLTRLLNLDHVWSDSQQAHAARCSSEGRTSAPRVWVAGDGAGIAGVAVARLRGALAGLDVARSLGMLEEAAFRTRAAPLRRGIARRAPARAFVDRLYAPLPVTALAGSADETLVCRCEAVTLGRVREAIHDGATGPNRVKTFTRCGMGACQGRMCGNALTRIVAEATGAAPGAAGALRIRPPLKPTLISDYLEMAPDDEAPA